MTNRTTRRLPSLSILGLPILGLLAAGTLAAADWPNWRGPLRTGASPETGLIEGWSTAGENVLWKVDFVGRSTPVVFDGKVCVNGRAGEDVLRQEVVACFDAEDGEKLWERRFTVYHTSVPWTRVAWANLAADPETGTLFAQGAAGLFTVLDADTGETVWQRNLIEEFGFMEGYGGRTQTPLVDEDRVVVSFSNTSWGEEARPLHRYRAFDKRTGELLWVSTPAPSQADKNTQSTPAPALIGGRRLVVAGNGGGGIYAVEARTGRPIWGFQLSKRGINTSVVVDGTTVYATHGEENLDQATLGRVVAIDGTGRGDVTASHEIWRSPVSAGYATPALHDGTLYVLDTSGKVHALDAATGAERWDVRVGRIGRTYGPTFADGKLFTTDATGRVGIVRPGDGAGEVLDLEAIEIEGRAAEMWGSVAIAYGRLYFTTEEGLYCLGDPERPFAPESGPALALEETPAAPDGAAVTLSVRPYEVLLAPGESVTFRVEAFDDLGRALGPREATWSVADLAGAMDGATLSVAADAADHVGTVVARAGELEVKARVRVVGDLPMAEDFEAVELGSRPAYMMAYLAVWTVEELEGEKVLRKGPSAIKIDRHITFLGRPDHHDYTISADVMGTTDGRQRPDMGLINSGYTAELQWQGSRPGQTPGPKLEIRSWQAGLRMARTADYDWQPGVWYRMALTVTQREDDALIRAKVWPRDEPEPEAWTLEVEDPLPIRSGSAGLSAYSPVDVYWDNIEVTPNP